MGYSEMMINTLKRCKTLRHEMLAIKLAENAGKRAAGVIKGVQPTQEAKQVVRFLEKEEKRILNSNAAKSAFEQTAKPEANYMALEDCFTRSYMRSPEFWMDPHNKQMAELAKVGDFGYMTTACEQNGVREYVQEWLGQRKILGEVPSVIDRSKLKIEMPFKNIKKYPKSPTITLEGGLVKNTEEYEKCLAYAKTQIKDYPKELNYRDLRTIGHQVEDNHRALKPSETLVKKDVKLDNGRTVTQYFIVDTEKMNKLYSQKVAERTARQEAFANKMFSKSFKDLSAE